MGAKTLSFTGTRVRTNDGFIVEVYAYPRGITPMRRNNRTVFTPAIVVFGRALLLYFRHISVYHGSWVVDIRDGDTLASIVQAEVPSRAVAMECLQEAIACVEVLDRSEVHQALGGA
jgi:hypothetical protein